MGTDLGTRPPRWQSHRDGQGFCRACQLAWPCPTASGLLELAEIIRRDIADGDRAPCLDALIKRLRGVPRG